MLWWAILLWCAVAVLLAALHHRLQRLSSRYPPEVAAFLLRFETVLAENHPEVQFLGMVPGRFACLLRVKGQETPVGLHDAWRHAEAFPQGFTQMVAQLVADITEVGLDHVDDLDFAAAAPLLMPQVRARKWIDEQGTFGGATLVQRPMNDELATVYVIDHPTSMVFVCREHLKRWRKTDTDVHNIALANLQRSGGGAVVAADATKEPMVLQTGDGYDASRVLLLEQAEGLLVAIPDRDTLWVGGEQGQNLEQLMATTEAIAEKAAHPVSPSVFRVTDGRLQPLSGRD